MHHRRYYAEVDTLINMPIYSLDFRTYNLVATKLHSKPDVAERGGGHLRVLRDCVQVDGGVRTRHLVRIYETDGEVENCTVNGDWHRKADIAWHDVSLAG